MQLYTSTTSPYARLVRVALAEKQLSASTDYQFLDPWQDPAALQSVNAVCRVPTLVTDDGEALTEAAVILLFLERRYPEPRLMGRDNVEQVHARLGQALGCIDAGVGVITERRHGDPETALTRRRAAALERSAHAIAEAVDVDGDGKPDLGSLAQAVTLAWLDFRFAAELPWREQHPATAEWLDRIRQRPSFVETQPPAA
jgi:glutathione S-transferase